MAKRIRVVRVTFDRIDDDFVLTRNAPDRTAPLADKRIHLIGAGAVGSTLADRLVQAGAGKGRGQFHIFDPDRLNPENLGRHLLGVTYLGLNKAEGVAHYLKRNRLAMNVKGHALSGAQADMHRDADLVIDATSAPNIGAMLGNTARTLRRWSLMYVFVEGEGWVAGSYLYRGRAGEACRNCLEPWIGGTGSHVRKTYEPKPRDNGCGGSYTPYRAAAADIAAALASELACDWATDSVVNRYRSVRLPNAPKHVRDGYYSSPQSKVDCICGEPQANSSAKKP
ncbi:ThiF family adenylyltransferase [Hydrocarboniphaga sp.]|uniref:ThiF family adenylyltransferase n=1 Tax=Hydrocarboniphaga sp. TaxID=2033016 RepID=UPI003D1134BC